jgi:hypothetical protein
MTDNSHTALTHSRNRLLADFIAGRVRKNGGAT